MSKLKPHPLCSLMPPQKECEYEVLKESIKTQGFDPDHKIVLFEGKILDGMNRYEACLKLGVEPQFTDFIGTREEAAKFVYWEQLGRRNLNPNQRTFLVAKFRHEFNKGKNREEKMSLDEAAKLADVSVSKMEKASSVTLRNDKYTAKGISGELSPHKAMEALAAYVPEKFTGDHWEAVTRTADKIKAFEDELAQLAHKHLDPILGMPGAEMLEAALRHQKREKGTNRVLLGASLVEDLLLVCRRNRPCDPCPVCNGAKCQDCGERGYITAHEKAQAKNWKNERSGK